MKMPSGRHRLELDLMNQQEHLNQPNRTGTFECVAECGQLFGSEAGFTYHRRPTGRVSYECLNSRILLREGFEDRPLGWAAPRTIEYWYLEQLWLEGQQELSGFRRESW